MATNDRFELAAQRMRDNRGLSLTNEQRLQLYGYYKQVRAYDQRGTRLYFNNFFRQQKVLAVLPSRGSSTSLEGPNGTSRDSHVS